MLRWGENFVTNKAMIAAAAVAMAALACGQDRQPAAERLGVVQQDINGPWYTPSFTETNQAGAAMHSGNVLESCTATVIAPNFFLSAKHCGYVVGSTIFRYLNGDPLSLNKDFAYTVDQVIHAPCTGNDKGSWSDCNGDWADMVLLHVQQPIVASGWLFDYTPSATLAWTYPGANWVGTKVGAGWHSGTADNPFIDLRAVDDTLVSSDDSGGRFDTGNVRVNPGDSGGPFYSNGRVLGTVTGYCFPWCWRATYTSVPHRLDWVLSAIGYSLPLSGWAYDRALSGNGLEWFTGTERVCQYACQHTPSCGGYNYYRATGLCETLSSVGASSPAPGFTTGQR